MNTFSKMWNIRTPQEAKDIIAAQIADLNITDPSNLEEQALSLVGKDVYEKLVKGYTEKQWGRDCKELPAFIIRRLPLRFTYDNNYFNDRYQGIPIGGYTAIVEKLLEGSDVRTGVDFLNIRDEYEALADIIWARWNTAVCVLKQSHLTVRSIRAMQLLNIQSARYRIPELSSISTLNLVSRRKQLFPESILPSGKWEMNRIIR